jgi:cytochrome c oxidase subunit 3
MTILENDTYPAEQFEDEEQQRLSVTMGMWAFLITEVMFIGALFVSFFMYRMRWKETFIEASRHLEWRLGCLNTFILLTSSFTMVLAVHFARTNDRKNLVRMLIVTILLGFGFVGVKSAEYHAEYVEKLIPGLNYQADIRGEDGHIEEHRPPERELYMGFYFVMTGLHALHMLVGILVMGVITWFAHKGKYTSGNGYYNPVEMAGLYWHFVDLVWVFLFPTLYLLRS